MPSRLVIGMLFAYGVGLALLAVALGAGGDGILAPLCVAVSPLGILLVAFRDSSSPLAQNAIGLPLLLVGSIQWGVLGLVQRWRSLKGMWIAGFLLLHYAVAAYLIAGPYADEANRWAQARQFAMGYVVFAAVWYLAGQVLLWTTLVRRADSHLRAA